MTDNDFGNRLKDHVDYIRDDIDDMVESHVEGYAFDLIKGAKREIEESLTEYVNDKTKMKLRSSSKRRDRYD